MASLLREVETSPDSGIESDMVGLAGIVALLLLIFAAGYLIVYPNHPVQGYSSLYWNRSPSLSMENGIPSVVFSVELESRELSVSHYRIHSYIEGKVATTKTVDLNVNSKEEISFTIPVSGNISGKRPIKVTAQRIVDSNREKASPILEIMDWADLSLNNSN